MTDVDLFGNPVEETASAPGAQPVTNDMDLVQTVLAYVNEEHALPLHHDADSTVRRCGTRGTVPAPSGWATVVAQLFAARYLTTTRIRHGCMSPEHGPVITTTQTGRAAVCRWKAYHRPASWGPTPDNTEGNRGEHGE